MRFPPAARWTLWLVSLGLLCALAALRLDPKHLIDTDILSMLPAEQDAGALAEATRRSREAFVDEVLLLVSGPDDAATRAAASAARASALKSGLKADDTEQSLDALLALFQAHRYVLLDDAQAARFDKDGPQALATDVAVALGSPTGMVDAFGNDPGGELARYLSGLPRPYPEFLPDGPFFSALKGSKRYYLLRTELASGAFAADGSSQASHAVQTARVAVATACPECGFAATGAPLFADVARREAQGESVWLSLASTLLIMLLIAYVFRSFAPHVLAGTQLVASVLAGAAAVILCFGSLQVLTLVFGTTLIGIAIDYAFLYFAEYWFGDSTPEEVARKVRPGLLMGLVTGIAAFAFLLLAGFPALSQFAVFSVAGLLEAGLMVVLVFPSALSRPAAVPLHAAAVWPQDFIQAACRASRWRLLLPVAVLLLAAPGLMRLHASDDIRGLQNLPAGLLATDEQIRVTLGQMPPPGFFLIEAPDLDQALVREETLFTRLHAAVPDAAALGLSRFLPSPARQQASLAAWGTVFAAPDALEAAFRHFGLPASLANQMSDDWRKTPPQALDAASLFAAAPDLKRFVIQNGDGVALLSTLTGKADIDSGLLTRAAATLPGTRFVVPLDRIADTFQRIRVRATYLVILGYLLISALLLWRYGRREALRMLYPPLLALTVTLGLLGWLAEPVNIFGVVALILILGLGRDYAVFLREGGARGRSPALAVTLSALTMVCSFGLLALSHIPVLHSFGLTTLIGILASYLTAPLSLAPTRRETR